MPFFPRSSLSAPLLTSLAPRSLGTTRSEFVVIDLGAPMLLNRVVFHNRNPQTPSCWTPPASWTAAGIAGTCDTRAINSTLSVLDADNSTLVSMRLSASLVQTLFMACSASPTAAPSASASATNTMTATLTRGVSPSQTASVTSTATISATQTPSASVTATISSIVNGCRARYVRYQNTPGIANINFYEVMALNVSGLNVALGKQASHLSVNAANNAAFRGVDGVLGETSYYNSGGTSSAEFWQVDFAEPLQIYNVTFFNRQPQIATCWTPPAAWAARGVVGWCNTRAINSTLSVLDAANATLASMTLDSTQVQSMLLRCTPSPTPTSTQSPTSTQTGTATLSATATRSLPAGLSPSQTSTATQTGTGSQTPSQTPTASVTPSMAVLGCNARYVRVDNTPGVALQNWYEVSAYTFNGTNVALNKPASCLSVWNAANGASKAVDGVVGEASYYNGGTTSANE